MESTQRQMLHNAYSQVTTVWNLGSDEQRVLADQIMNDITKLLKFAKRYKPDNFSRKYEILINGAKDLCAAYKEYKSKQASDYEQFLAKYDNEIAALIKEQEVLASTTNDLIEQKSNVVEVVQMEEMNNAPKKQKEGQVTLSLRGGKREGAGRKPVIDKGIVRKVSITLPQEQWDIIDNMIDGVEIKSVAQYFRMLVMPDSPD